MAVRERGVTYKIKLRDQQEILSQVQKGSDQSKRKTQRRDEDVQK